MEKLQHEYLGLVSELHVREYMLLQTPDLESEISVLIATLKRRIAVKAMVLNSQKISIPIHTLDWSWDSKKERKWLEKYKASMKVEPKVVVPVMGDKPKKKPKSKPIVPRKVKIRND